MDENENNGLIITTTTTTASTSTPNIPTTEYSILSTENTIIQNIEIKEEPQQQEEQKKKEKETTTLPRQRSETSKVPLSLHTESTGKIKQKEKANNNNNENEVLIEEYLTIKKNLVKVILTPHHLIYSNTKIPLTIILGTTRDKFLKVTVDINDSSQPKPKKKPKKSVFQFVVHACILVNEKKGIREHARYRFVCENEQQLIRWETKINQVLNPPDRSGPNGRRILVLINPFSGTKLAPKIFKQVRPLFDLAGCVITVTETTHGGHAKEIGMTVNYNDFDAIICVSGDGLLNELISGIMERQDWEKASKISIGLISGGSGNGLASSLGIPHPITASLVSIKGFTRPFDLAMIMDANRRWWSFLTLTWGIISDVDIESEKYRWMGEPRFTLAALKRIATLRTYHGKLAYLPIEPENENEKQNENKNDQKEKRFGRCSAYHKCVFCQHIQTEPIESQSMSSEGASNSGEIIDHSNPQQKYQSLNSVFLENPNILPSENREFPSEFPPGWKVVESDFILFIATNVTLISSDFVASPYAHLSDGYFDLVLLKNSPSISKFKILKLFMDSETGNYVHDPICEHHKVKALYLQPGAMTEGGKIKERAGSEGVLSVDGEKIPYVPVSLEVFRGVLNLMCFE